MTTPAVWSKLWCVAALAALAAACESVEQPAGPRADGHYLREGATEDLTVGIRIPDVVAALPGAGQRIVAEADAEAADVARRAAQRRRESPDLFRPSELLVEWTVAYDARGLVSALGESYLYEGGANGLETRRSLLYDRTAGREVAIEELFADPRPNGQAMTALSEAAFAAWTEASPAVEGRSLALVDEYIVADARQALRPRAESFATFVLTPADGRSGRVAGLTLLYPEGVLGPRSDGAFDLFVPMSVLAPHLDPAWAERLGTGGR